ncbi:MAG: PDGLE domain-containing protein [Actinomycetales bacterium]|nr:PDGLE domain-containing protein [Actinomycetales bacterium]
MSRRLSVTVFIVLGLLVSLLIAGIVSHYASASPDGLEFVAEQEGFLDTAQDSAVAGSPLADYGIAGVGDPRLSVGLAGILGVIVTAAVGFGLFWLLLRGRGTPARR